VFSVQKFLFCLFVSRKGVSDFRFCSVGWGQRCRPPHPKDGKDTWSMANCMLTRDVAMSVGKMGLQRVIRLSLI
jgi:hypothetical protein